MKLCSSADGKARVCENNLFFLLLFLTYSFQNAEVGSNLIKVASTRATALKEKDSHVYCQPEVLYEGRIHPFSQRCPKPLSVIPFYTGTGKSREGS